MRYLDDLTPDQFEENRSPVLLARLQGWMLWPSDPARRMENVLAAQVEHLIDTIDEIAAVEGPDSPAGISLADLSSIIEYAHSVANWRTQVDEVERHFEYGYASGSIVCHVIEAWLKNPKMSGIQRAKRLAVAASSKRRSARITIKTIEDPVWRRYRRVAHLWCAFIARATVLGDRAFPCRLEDVENFLATAEFFRQTGEGIQPPQSRGTLLRNGETLCIPEDILPRLPRCTEVSKSWTVPTTSGTVFDFSQSDRKRQASSILRPSSLRRNVRRE